MEHMDRFEKNGDNIQCGLCKETFTRQFLRVNKRFKASIDNEEYLTDIEKNLKIESKTILSNLQRNIEALNPIESSIKSLNTTHFENMRKNIDEQTNNLKNQIDSYSCLLKNRSSQLEEEYSKKILIAGKQVKSLRNDYGKKSDFLEELFRTPNLSVETVNSNKQELNNILHQSELLKRNLDKMCTDINSVVFEANTSFCQELFGSLNSKLNSNLTRFENENAQETLLPANIDEPNLDPIRVSSTTNLEPTTVNSTLSPHVEFNMNDYNSCEETSETSNSNDEVEKCYDILSNYKKNVETTKDTFLSLTRPYNFQGKKMNSGFIIIDLNTFKTIKKSSFDCKAWCAHVFQGDKIFIGTTGGLIKLVSLNDTKMCYRSFCGKSKQRVNCLKVLPEKNKNRVLLASGHQDCVIKIWDIDTASCLFILEGHMSWINCIECLPNGNIISGSNDGTMKIWNLEDGSLIKTLTRKTSKISNKSQSIYCLKVLDDQRIACGSGIYF
jgi:WD40 repeat protein